MILRCKSYVSYCALETFVINGIKASYEDFGTKEDVRPEIAQDYDCGDMQFTPKPASQEVLDKYGINVDEYNEVCEKLDEELSFGECGWCT